MSRIADFAHRTEIVARFKRALLIFWLPLVLLAIVPAIVTAISARFEVFEPAKLAPEKPTNTIPEGPRFDSPSISPLPTIEAPSVADNSLMKEFPPFVADCQASSERTCDKTECRAAPDNFVFWRASLNVLTVSRSGTGSTGCYMSVEDVVNTEIPLPNGVKTTMDLPRKVCINAHAETGSRASINNRHAWAQCEIRGRWVQLIVHTVP